MHRNWWPVIHFYLAFVTMLLILSLPGLEVVIEQWTQQLAEPPATAKRWEYLVYYAKDTSCTGWALYRKYADVIFVVTLVSGAFIFVTPAKRNFS